MSFSFTFHRFSPFICCLSVVLWVDKADFPENLHTVCPSLNGRFQKETVVANKRELVSHRDGF